MGGAEGCCRLWMWLAVPRAAVCAGCCACVATGAGGGGVWAGGMQPPPLVAACSHPLVAATANGSIPSSATLWGHPQGACGRLGACPLDARGCISVGAWACVVRRAPVAASLHVWGAPGGPWLLCMCVSARGCISACVGSARRPVAPVYVRERLWLHLCMCREREEARGSCVCEWTPGPVSSERLRRHPSISMCGSAWACIVHSITHAGAGWCPASLQLPAARASRAVRAPPPCLYPQPLRGCPARPLLYHQPLSATSITTQPSSWPHLSCCHPVHPHPGGARSISPPHRRRVLALHTAGGEVC